VPKDLKKDLKKAKAWCEKARDILKLKKSGVLIDTTKASVESKALEEAMKSVRAGLDKLQSAAKKDVRKQSQYEQLAQAFVDLGDVGELAVTEGNKKIAEYLTANLKFLDLRIQDALGTLPSGVDLGEEKRRIQAELRNECEAAMKKAKAREEELKKYTVGPHVFTGNVPTLIGVAEEHLKDNRYQYALLNLGKVQAEVGLQLKRRTDYAQYLRNLEDAKDLERELSIVDRLNNANSSKPVRDVIEAANKLVAGFDYAGGLTKLAEAQKAYDSAMKSLPKGDREKVKAFAQAKAHFEERYGEEKDRINQAGKLRGATESPVKEHLDGARLDLQSARLACDRAKSVDDVKNAEKVLDGIEKKVESAATASSTAKKESKTDLKSQKEWLAMVRQAENAQDQMKAFRGVEAEQIELTTLLAKAKKRIVTDGAFTTGYVEALTELKGYALILSKAQNKHQSIMSLDLPDEIKQQGELMYAAIRAYGEVAPSFMTSMQWDEIPRLGGALRTELQKAVGEEAKREVIKKWLPELKKFEQQVTADRDKLVLEKKSATETIAKFHDELKKLRDKKVPEGMLVDSVRAVRVAEETDIADFEWARAEAKAKRGLESLKETSDYFDLHAGEWTKKQQKLDEYKALALKLMKWPPTSVAANSLLESIRAINDRFARSHDFEACSKEYVDEKIEHYGAELKKLEGTAPSDAKIDEVREALKQANIAVQDAASAVRTKKLWALENKLQGVADPSKTAFHTALDKLLTAWYGFYGKPFPPTQPGASPGAPDLKFIEKQKTEYLKALEALGKKVDEALKDKEKLAGVAGDIKREEERKNESRLPEHVKELIAQLLQMGGIAGRLTNEYELIVNDTSGKVTEDKKTALLKKLREKVLVAIDGRREEIERRKQAAATRANELGESLTDLKHRYKNFKNYNAELDKQLGDIREMIESGDPDLLQMANKNMGELGQKIAEIDPENMDEDSVRYSNVEAKWKELSEMLGSKETRGGSLTIQNRLPNTYQKLLDQLNSAIVEAKKMSPAQGLEVLTKLEKPIADALEKARLVNDEHERFKESVRQLEFRWAGIKAETRTRVTDRTKAFEALFETRIREANAMRHAEDGLPAAYKLLNVVNGMLNEITLAPDKRAKLQELDAACAQEQRDIRDWARQFEVDRKDFAEKILSEAEKQVTKNYEDGLITKQDRDDNQQMLTSLKDVASGAAKIVKPYLANLETLPHKRIGSNQSPDPKKAEADFAKARQMLADAKKSADRIASATSSTNVNIVGDLMKVQMHWAEQVRNFSTAVRSAADSIPTKIEELIKSGEITGTAQTAKNNAAKAQTLLVEMASRFRADAFAGPFAILTTEPPKDKAAKEKLAKEKLAAREQVLRIMRQCRTDLLNHPVLTKMTDKKNPFDGPKLMAASGYLRAALKRIEIETLIGV
jgi:hypothetical protein